VEGCFEQLAQGRASQVVVPIENASSGMITPTVDQLILLARQEQPDLAIREALTLRVKLVLLARKKGAPVKTIYSHPAPFAHAGAWLARNFPDAKRVALTSTSEAARRAGSESGSAAIAGRHCAELYGLEVLAEGVGAEVGNQTTFFVVGDALPGSGPSKRVAMVLELPHRPGALLAVLTALAKEDLNLTKIESRPIPGRFSEYRFLIEFEGAQEDAIVQRALKRLRKVTAFLAVIGSYPLRRLR
jgi:chorismate mutase / prephenate dehydratase